MPEYTCKRCHYCTKQKCAIRVHLTRSNPCKVSENAGQDISCETLLQELGDIRQRKREVICDQCGEGFASQPSMSRHRKNCKQSNTTEKKLDDVWKYLCKNNASNVSSVSNSNNVINSNNQININIVAHGKEDISYLTKEFLTYCVKDITAEGIPKLIEQVHFNDQVPQNRNIGVLSNKQNLMKTFNGDKWNAISKNTALDNMIIKGRNIAFKHYNNNEFTDIEMQYIQNNFQYLADELNKQRSSLRSKIRNHIYSFFRNSETT